MSHADFDPSRMRLLTGGDIRALAQQLGLRPTKTLGQNFVTDPNTIRRIMTAAKIEPGETVLEVGPGLGSLTAGLLQAGAEVVAVEIDPPLAQQLPHTIAEAASCEVSALPLQVITADARRVNMAELQGITPTALVANLPYNVAVPVLLHLFELLPSLRHTLVMVQAEVAYRLAAEPGSKVYGIPSVKANWYGQVRLAGTVGAKVFWPVPRVESALVHIEAHTNPPVSQDQLVPSRALLFEIVDAAFGQRRKTLRAALAGWAGSPMQAETLLRQAGIDPQRRAETLDLSDFVSLAVAATSAGMNSSKRAD